MPCYGFYKLVMGKALTTLQKRFTLLTLDNYSDINKILVETSNHFKNRTNLHRQNAADILIIET